MKNLLKITSIISITLFGILWLLSKFTDSADFNTIEIRNILVLIYLFTSLKYYQLESREKNAIIKELKEKLGE